MANAIFNSNYQEEEIEEFDTLDDYMSNMPCDNSGYCDPNCRRYFECQEGGKS